MTTSDRRSGRDRRHTQRFKITLEIDWENQSGRQQGTLGDISELGCFILGPGDVYDGETIKQFLPFDGGREVPFLGEVINHVFEIGFAVRFIDLGSAQKKFLTNFVLAGREN